MPKITKELGALAVSRLTTEGVHAVGGVQGLYLRVKDTGSRSWVYRYVINGARRRMGLGPFPTITLSMARDRAREARNKVDQGIDPIGNRFAVIAQKRQEESRRMPFELAARKAIAAKAVEWTNAKHALQWSSSLETYAYPVLSKMDVQEIETRHILEVLEPIWIEKTETASRLRGRIEAVLDWATAHQSRTGLNPARWVGHLDQLLAKPSRVAKVKHHEAVPYKDVAQVLAKVANAAGQGARALQLQVLTATRSGEVRGAVWEEFDLAGKVWVIPAERMKARKEHRIPLSAQAVALLESLPKGEGCDLAFPSERGKPLSDMTITAVMRRMELTAVPHGFRSTFRDWAAECTNYPKDVIEMALAHAIENKVEAAYRRGDLFEKRMQLMQDWADYCAARTTF